MFTQAYAYSASQEQLSSTHPMTATGTDDNSQVFSVTQINHTARLLLEQKLNKVAVLGEISACKWDASGHCWLVLKDEQSALACVVFRREAARYKAILQNGTSVTAVGRLTIYPATGRYQLVAQVITAQGTGALKLQLEALTEKLRQEGLFTQERKQKLPVLPTRVAVLTSLQGAVLRDILHIQRRRDPRVKLLVVPTKVQGGECTSSVVQALQGVSHLHQTQPIDVVIIARGGGSFEDLWGYQQEELVRAVAGMTIPVVSAIGHETDTTLLDFVADVRAPTPSAAAEIVFPVIEELQKRLQHYRQQHAAVLHKRIGNARLKLRALLAELGEPTHLLYPFRQTLSTKLQRCCSYGQYWVKQKRHKLHRIQLCLQAAHPKAILQRARHRLLQTATRMRTLRMILQRKREQWRGIAQKIHALSPLQILGRGYSIVLHRQEALRSIHSVEIGERIRIRLTDGSLEATVETKLEELIS